MLDDLDFIDYLDWEMYFSLYPNDLLHYFGYVVDEKNQNEKPQTKEDIEQIFNRISNRNHPLRR